jgi:hypothetical protein
MKTIKTNDLKYGIVIFVTFLFLMILTDKFTGNINRFNSAYYEPSSWSKIISHLPLLIILSLVGAIGTIQIRKESQKSEDKSIESARKRIEEREKQEKEKTAENSETIKEGDDKE